MQIRVICVVAAFSCALISTPIQAAIIMQGFAGPGFADLDQFDPALGTLNSVTAHLEVSVTWFGELAYEPIVEDPQIPSEGGFAFAWFSQSTYEAYWPASLPASSLQVVQDGEAGFYFNSPGFELRFLTGVSSQELVEDVAPFIGTGTIAFEQFGDPGSLNLALGPGVHGDQDSWFGDVQGCLTLTYEFTPVPEPSTFTLLLIAAAAVVPLRLIGLASVRGQTLAP